MALSGSFTGTAINGWYLKMEWYATQNIVNNTSTITATLKVFNKWYSHNSNASYRINNDSLTSFSYNYPNNGEWHTLGTKTYTVTHNADGTYSGTLSGVFNSGMSTSHTPASLSVSSTIYLDTIPRASIPSIITTPNTTYDIGYIGDTVGIYTNRKYNKFKHTVTYKFGDLTGTIRENAEEGISWKIPNNFLTEIPNAASGIGSIFCTTYNGSTKIGDTVEVKFKCKVNEDEYKPIFSGFSAKVTDTLTKTLTGKTDTIIDGVSTVRTSVQSREARGSATVKTDYMYADDIGYTSSYHDDIGYYRDFINTIATKYQFKVRDSRNFIAESTTKTFNKIAYVPVTANLAIENPNPEGSLTLNISGNFFNQSFGAVTNTLTLKYRYKEESGSYSDWIDITGTPSKSNGQYTHSQNVTGLDYTKIYTFQVEAIDSVNRVATSSEIKVNFKPSFYWNNKEFNFNVPVNLIGGLVDQSYIGDGAEETEGTFKIGDIRVAFGRTLATCNADEASLTSVSFPEGFINPPTVILTPISGGAFTYVKECSAANITKSDFDICIYRIDNVSTGVNWLAIGV